MLAYVSPVGVLADGYLFSAHMVQHLLLLLVDPAVLDALAAAAADPAEVRNREDLNVLRVGQRSRSLPGLSASARCGFGMCRRYAMHRRRTEQSGLIRDGSFVAAGLVFWSPIYSPFRSHRIRPLDGIAYLFSACLGCTLLGIYLTFTTLSVCPAFASPVDRINILNRLYDAGLTPGVDQHIGGLLMWVPPCTLYVGGIVSLLCRWYAGVEPVNAVGANAARKRNDRWPRDEQRSEPVPRATGLNAASDWRSRPPWR